VLAAMSGPVLLSHPVDGCPRCFLPHEKLHLREICASGGGLLVAPHLFQWHQSTELKHVRHSKRRFKSRGPKDTEIAQTHTQTTGFQWTLNGHLDMISATILFTVVATFTKFRRCT